jgi:hypothetical protein
MPDVPRGRTSVLSASPSVPQTPHAEGLVHKHLAIGIALLAASAAAAVADPNANVSWNNCDISGAFRDKFYACDGALGSTLGIQGTFISSVNIPDFAGASSIIYIAFAGPGVPDYWRVDGPHGCDYGALSLINPTATAPCVTPNIFQVGQTGGGYAVEFPTSYFMVLRIDWATGASPPPSVSAGGLYPAFKLSFDPDQGALNGCAGCSVPVCLILQGIQVFGFQTNEVYTLGWFSNTPNYLTWQGGAIGGAGCPGATPTSNRTWGAVKTLYR